MNANAESGHALAAGEVDGPLTAVEQGLVDELCLSLSPMLIGGTSSRIVASREAAAPTPMELRRILHQDGLTFHRYTR